MKTPAARTNIPCARIYPHNLRHLFAVTYYEREKDVVRLADILGHANINTTRIYTMITCETQLGILDGLGEILNPHEDLWEKTLIPEIPVSSASRDLRQVTMRSSRPRIRTAT